MIQINLTYSVPEDDSEVKKAKQMMLGDCSSLSLPLMYLPNLLPAGRRVESKKAGFVHPMVNATRWQVNE